MADHIPSLGPQRALSTVPRLVGHVGGHAFGSDIMGGSAVRLRLLPFPPSLLLSAHGPCVPADGCSTQWADTLGDSTRNRLIAFGDTSAMGSSKD